jgi:hypothetical protein
VKHVEDRHWPIENRFQSLLTDHGCRIMSQFADWYQQRLIDEVAWAFALEAGEDAIHPAETLSGARAASPVDWPRLRTPDAQPAESVDSLACKVAG